MDKKTSSPSFNLTPVGKLFFGSLVAWIVKGGTLNWKVRGEGAKMQALAKAVIASKRFQEELKNPEATIDSVIEKMNLKNMSSQEFEELTGTRIPI